MPSYRLKPPLREKIKWWGGGRCSFTWELSLFLIREGENKATEQGKPPSHEILMRKIYRKIDSRAIVYVEATAAAAAVAVAVAVAAASGGGRGKDRL